jgi:hypothetical protein
MSARTFLVLEQIQRALHQPTRARIHKEKENSEKRHRGDHHRRRRYHIVPRRPGHFLHLDPNFVQELAPALRRIDQPLKKTRLSAISIVAPSRFRCFRHLFHRCAFIVPLPRSCLADCRARARLLAFARPTNLAGEEGLEPPHPVLETGGLPLNLLPYTHSPPATGPALRCRASLLHFAMHGVFPAAVAKFLRLQALGMFLPVLGGRVVPVLAIVALERDKFAHGVWSLSLYLFDGYSMISVTAPAPTVWPPSRIAKRKPFSRATGVINAISIATLSPGITISTPAGNFTSPVTSVVRK